MIKWICAGGLLILLAAFQNCRFQSRDYAAGGASFAPQSALSAPVQFNDAGFGALGAKFKDGRIYVFSGSKLHSSADGENWRQETSVFWQTSLQLAGQAESDQTVYQVDSSPMIYDATAGVWKTSFIELEQPNGAVKTAVSDLTFVNLPAPSNVGSSRVDLQACKLEYSIVSPK